MKTIIKLLSIFAVVAIFSGCAATWEGVKKDSAKTWDATKEMAKDTYEAGKDAMK